MGPTLKSAPIHNAESNPEAYQIIIRSVVRSCLQHLFHNRRIFLRRPYVTLPNLHFLHVPAIIASLVEATLCVEHRSQCSFYASLFHANDEELIGDERFPDALSAAFTDAFVEPVYEQLDGVSVEVDNLWKRVGYEDYEGKGVVPASGYDKTTLTAYLCIRLAFSSK